MEAPESRPAEVRQEKPDTARVINAARSTVDAAAKAVTTSVLVPENPTGVMKQVEEELALPANASILRAYATLKDMKPGLREENGAVVLSMEGKDVATVSSDQFERGVWKAEVLQMLRRPIGSFIATPDEQTMLASLYRAEAGRGLLMNLQRLKDIKTADPVGAMKLLDETAALLDIEGTMEAEPVSGTVAGLLLYKKGDTTPVCYVELGSQGQLDGQQNVITRSAPKSLLKSPAVDQLPEAALIVHMLHSQKIDPTTGRDAVVQRQDGNFVLTYAAGAKTVTMPVK